MAGSLKAHETNSYNAGERSRVAANSIVIEQGDAVSESAGTLIKAIAGGTIIGVSTEDKTYDSDNVTVAKETLNYKPETESNNTYDIEVTGQTITFAGALVASNTIDLKVNGVAMTTETFDTTDAQTLTNIAAQMVTDFASIVSASTGTNSITFTPIEGNSSAVVTDIVVAAGATQTTGTVAANTIVQADVDSYFDLTTTGQKVNYHSLHATSGQVKLVGGLGAIAEFTIVNT